MQPVLIKCYCFARLWENSARIFLRANETIIYGKCELGAGDQFGKEKNEEKENHEEESEEDREEKSQEKEIVFFLGRLNAARLLFFGIFTPAFYAMCSA